MIMKRTYVFFRDDDIGPLTEELMSFVGIFLDKKIPVNYQIIPERLTQETAGWLVEIKKKYPDLIHLNQHGYCHALYDSDGNMVSIEEFGNSVGLNEQYENIMKGRTILENSLGSLFSPVFTPPGNKYNASTIKALEMLGYSVNSASSYFYFSARLFYFIGRMLKKIYLGHAVSHHGKKYPGYDIVELSINIDVDMRLNRNGESTVAGIDQLLREFRKAKKYYPVIGIMLHHHTYKNEAKFNTLKDFIHNIKEDRTNEIKSIEEICESQELIVCKKNR